MSGPGRRTRTYHEEESGRLQRAPPEESCGDLITELPGGKHVWVTTGQVANEWQTTLSLRIRRLLGNQFQQTGVSLFIYMVGRRKSTSSPVIIFCSSDMKARKDIRSAVHLSGILTDYPAVRLGDSSSPLARGDSGLYQHLPRPAIPQSSHGSREEQSEKAPAPVDSSSNATHAESRNLLLEASASASPRTPQGDDASLRRRLESIRLDSQSTSSLGNSADGASTRSIGSEAPLRDWTPRSSLHTMFSVTETRSETPTVEKESDFRNWATPSDSSSELDDTEGSTSTDSSSLYPAVTRQMDRIFSKLLMAYYSRRQQTTPVSHQAVRDAHCEGVGDSHRPGGPSGESQSAEGGASQVSKGKRPLKEDGCVPATAQKRAKEAHRRGILLACPFWKHAPTAYSCCHKFGFEKVNRVKQHLHRNHSKPIRCGRCQDVFEDRDEVDNHLATVDCVRQPGIIDEGINDAQIAEMNRRGRANLTQEERWYLVWRIVFPGVKEPDSPHIDGDLSEDMSGFLEFYRRNGSTIVLDHMRTSSDWTQHDEERFRDTEWRGILERGLQGIVNRFLAQRSEGTSQTTTNTIDEPPVEEGSPDIVLDSPPSSSTANPVADGIPDDFHQFMSNEGDRTGIGLDMAEFYHEEYLPPHW